MASSDDEFLRELQAAFQAEAEEHLQVLSAGLLELEKSPGPDEERALLETVYREAHSLKGASRAVNLADVESVCQELETALSAWRRGALTPTPALFDTLHEALDTITALLATPDGTSAPPDRRRVAEVTRQLARAAAGAPEGARPAPAAPSPGEDAAPARAEAPPERPPERAPLPETVRISTAKLDALLLQTEELLTVKQATARRSAALRDTLALLESWERDWLSAAPEGSRAALKTVRGTLSGLTRTTERDSRDLGVQVDDLLDAAKTLLLMPFSTLMAVFPKMVRDLARDEGKDVQLVLRGGEVEIDRRILEDLKDPLTHLLRNSVDHGIETLEERASLGKPPRATVTLAVSQVGANEAEVLVADDGMGIDVGRVKESAVRHGAVSADAAAAMPDAEALMLIFQSEVSTSPIITEISGRGLGMAIVREKVEKMGGRITLETRPHEGTQFRLLLPLTLATFKGILVRVAGQVLVLPTAEVERVVRFRETEVRMVENHSVLAVDGRLIPLVRLDDVLGLRRPVGRAEGDLAPAVVLGTAEKRIAFRIEAILGEQEVLVKNLGEPLRRVRHLAGATVLGSGQPVPILSVPALLKSAALSPGHAGAGAGVPLSGKAVLVAEDSITSRMLLKSILEADGYQVTTAVDGQDALAALEAGDFALVVSDVDMPRMNGFDLTACLRADPRWAALPVVLVTARDTREDRERGIAAGASAYLVKSSFDQSNLLEVVRRLI